MSDDMVVGKAWYRCETRIFKDPFYTMAQEYVSVPRISGEITEQTEKRLKNAATKLNGMLTGGCYRKTFNGHISINEPFDPMMLGGTAAGTETPSTVQNIPNKTEKSVWRRIYEFFRDTLSFGHV